MDKNIELAVRQADRHIRCESSISRRLRKTSRLDSLPYDLILLIAEHLRARDVGALARVRENDRPRYYQVLTHITYRSANTSMLPLSRVLFLPVLPSRPCEDVVPSLCPDFSESEI